MWAVPFKQSWEVELVFHNMDGITNIEVSNFTNTTSSQTSTTGNQISNGLNFTQIPIESN